MMRDNSACSEDESPGRSTSPDSAKEEKTAKHRRQVVAEIITTETEYVQDLELIVRVSFPFNLCAAVYVPFSLHFPLLKSSASMQSPLSRPLSIVFPSHFTSLLTRTCLERNEPPALSFSFKLEPFS